MRPSSRTSYTISIPMRSVTLNSSAVLKEESIMRRECNLTVSDRKSTRLNSSHVEIYTFSLHDALPISVCKAMYSCYEYRKYWSRTRYGYCVQAIICAPLPELHTPSLYRCDRLP